MLAISFNLGGLFSGWFVATLGPILHAFPWVLALFPPILAVRGHMSGILSGKLGTMLHTGKVRPSLLGNTEEFYLLLKAIYALTFLDTVGMGLISFILNAAASQASIADFSIYLVVPTLTCAGTVLFSIPITSLFAATAFRRGLDPDVVVYPAMSTLNDILVAIFYVLIVGIVRRASIAGVAVLWLISAVFALIVISRNASKDLFKRTLLEGVPIVLLSSLLTALNGVFLASFRDELESKPAVLIIYPVLLSALGDIGSILGSMTTTKFALGYFTSPKDALKGSTVDLLAIEASAITAYAMFGVAGSVVSFFAAIETSATFLVKLAILSNVMGFLSISMISLLVAIGTFKRGWDPDSFVIPIVTSLADALATLFLFLSLVILGVV